jgi:hypothetical protein
MPLQADLPYQRNQTIPLTVPEAHFPLLTVCLFPLASKDPPTDDRSPSPPGGEHEDVNDSQEGVRQGKGASQAQGPKASS